MENSKKKKEECSSKLFKTLIWISLNSDQSFVFHWLSDYLHEESSAFYREFDQIFVLEYVCLSEIEKNALNNNSTLTHTQESQVNTQWTMMIERDVCVCKWRILTDDFFFFNWSQNWNFSNCTCYIRLLQRNNSIHWL